MLVNNAGLNVRADFRHLSDADWVKIREVNLDGVVRIARDGFALLRASGAGSLVNIASIMGHRGLRQLAAYSATKGAVSASTRTLAVEYAPFGIRVNALAPGFIETALTERVLKVPQFSKALLDKTPLGRFGPAKTWRVPHCSSRHRSRHSSPARKFRSMAAWLRRFNELRLGGCRAWGLELADLASGFCDCRDGVEWVCARRAESYSFDKQHTEVRFSWDHLGLSRQSGRFMDVSGSLMLDPDKPKPSPWR